ncbi:MAG: hypothetical protein ACU0CA_15285 [Paracoccaceae bacterium]
MTSSFEDEIRDFAAPSFDKLGISKTNAKALEAMAYDGISLPAAAERHNIRVQNLERVFNIPKVRTVYNELIAYIRSNTAQSAYTRINNLSVTTDSDRLRFDADRWLAGVGGIAPIKSKKGSSGFGFD